MKVDAYIKFNDGQQIRITADIFQERVSGRVEIVIPEPTDNQNWEIGKIKSIIVGNP